MSTTLTYGSVSITLPADLTWQDEYGWAQVEQKKTYGLTGSLLIEAMRKLTGRPIYLAGDASSGWVSRMTLDALRTAAGLAGQQFTLTLRGATHTVVFDHEAGAISASPVVDYADPIAGDFYIVTLRFIESTP